MLSILHLNFFRFPKTRWLAFRHRPCADFARPARQGRPLAFRFWQAVFAHLSALLSWPSARRQASLTSLVSASICVATAALASEMLSALATPFRRTDGFLFLLPLGLGIINTSNIKLEKNDLFLLYSMNAKNQSINCCRKIFSMYYCLLHMHMSKNPKLCDMI